MRYYSDLSGHSFRTLHAMKVQVLTLCLVRLRETKVSEKSRLRMEERESGGGREHRKETVEEGECGGEWNRAMELKQTPFHTIHQKEVRLPTCISNKFPIFRR